MTYPCEMKTFQTNLSKSIGMLLLAGLDIPERKSEIRKKFDVSS
jgi:hypothetical protein